jgi:hypothetical protein
LESSHLEHQEGDALYGWEVVELALNDFQCFYKNWFTSYELNNIIIIFQ